MTLNSGSKENRTSGYAMLSFSVVSLHEMILHIQKAMSILNG